MTRLHNFLPGDRIALFYPSVGANRHLGTVTEVSATSISVHVEGLLRPKPFFYSRKRHWFSERGRMVSIEQIPSQTAACSLTTDSPHGLTRPLRDCHSRHSHDVAITPEIEQALADHAPVAIGVSGGKDSSAVAIRTFEYLDDCGHRGPRLLIHCDLGEIEWAESPPTCERLAPSLRTELLVLRRGAGGLRARWRQRWETNKQRYARLECVRLIMPWSSAVARFCTSELKTAIACHASSMTKPRPCWSRLGGAAAVMGI